MSSNETLRRLEANVERITGMSVDTVREIYLCDHRRNLAPTPSKERRALDYEIDSLLD